MEGVAKAQLGGDFLIRHSPQLHQGAGAVNQQTGPVTRDADPHLKSERLVNYLSRDVDAFCTNRQGSEAILSGERLWNWDGSLTKNPATLRERLGGRWLTAEFKAGDVLEDLCGAVGGENEGCEKMADHAGDATGNFLKALKPMRRVVILPELPGRERSIPLRRQFPFQTPEASSQMPGGLIGNGMLTKLFSATLRGVDAIQVEVEVNSGQGDPLVVVVGLPDAAVRESKDRVTTAIVNSGLRWPRTRTTVNLAPADIKKEGPSFDLPIAIGMVAAAQGAESPRFGRCLIAGELALNGGVRPIKGALPMAIEARRLGKKALVLPEANAAEAAAVEGVQVFGVKSLRETYEFLTGAREIAETLHDPSMLEVVPDDEGLDFSEVKGQHAVRRAIEIAVAGNHALLLIGPPGSGKSMLARRIATIMPPLTLDEAIETTQIHSVAGLLDSHRPFCTHRPFRAPHHTISDVGLVGGSTNPSPGEISIAHNGVLFLDELPEFKRSTLEVLRQPLEERRVTVSRAAGSITFPANIMLVAAMNPCACGFFGDPKRECRCSPKQVENYRNRISGPLLDRIDIHVEAPAVEFKELGSREPGEPSAAIRSRVVKARQVQTERFAGAARCRCNAEMGNALIRRHCALDDASTEMLRHAMEELHLSARAYDRILKVARTIADLAGESHIAPPHLLEAIQFRTLDRTFWS